MKKTLTLVIAVTMALFTADGASSLPARSTDHLAIRLYGSTPEHPELGTYCDFFTSCDNNHLGGMACAWCVVCEDMDGTPIRQSGVKIGVGGVASNTDPEYPGRNLWPDRGAVVNVGRIPRAPTPVISTNKNGYIYPALFIGSPEQSGATPLCDNDAGISTKLLSDVVLLGRPGTPSPKISATYVAAPCNPANPVCACKATGFSGVIVNGTATCSTVTIEPAAGIGIFKMSEDDFDMDSDEPTPPDPNRSEQRYLVWPGEGWHRLLLDNSWDTEQGGMYIICRDPNQNRQNLVSHTEVWTYCEIIHSNSPRLSRLMADRPVGMNRVAQDQYMSDYLVYCDEASDAGKVSDEWGNPCYMLHLRDGQTIDPASPDPNVPGVIARWLTHDPNSDLNADGIVNLPDYAIAAGN